MKNELIEIAPASEPAPRSAYGAHGIMAPGVMMMRNMTFGIKSLVITLLFLSAIGLLAFSYYGVQLSNIAFSAKERVGVAYLQAAYPVLKASLDLRRDATAQAQGGQVNLAATKQAFQQALAGLEQAQRQFGQELSTEAPFRDMLEAARRADAFQGSALNTFNAYTQLSRSIIDLMLHATDTSNLTLDPDVDSYYVMDVVAFRLPDILERTGLLRGAGAAALRSGTLDSQIRDEMLRAYAITRFHIDSAQAGLQKTIAERPTIAARVSFQSTNQSTNDFIAAVNRHILGTQELNADVQAFLRLGDAAVAEQLKLADNLLVVLDELLAERVNGMQRSMWIKSALIVMVVLLAFYFFYAFFLVTRGGLHLISTHLLEMAEGDLRRAPSQPWGRDEPAQVITDLRQVYDSLHELIRRVRHSARDLTATSTEIAQAALDLSARTEANAASLEEQAAAMEQIGSQVSDSAQRAQSAAEFAQLNAKTATASREVVETVVGTMRDIQQSSSKIGDIIGVIDGIAFQTNILALNAAVEAARAGEAGRGFAVVASEVRSLAQRSADAAKEIKGLITTSVEKVEGGVKVVESAGTSIGELVNNADQINQYVVEISVAAREQAAGVEQVGQAIQQLDSSTQQNAALVEETSAAASALKDQADGLQREIARFRMK